MARRSPRCSIDFCGVGLRRERVLHLLNFGRSNGRLAFCHVTEGEAITGMCSTIWPEFKITDTLRLPSRHSDETRVYPPTPWAVAAIFTFVSSTIAFASPPSADNQLWDELDVTRAFSAGLSTTGIFTTRLGNNLPNPALTAVGLEIDYRMGCWTGSGTGYYVSIRNSESGAHTTVWVPTVSLTYRIDVGRLALSDRNRVEQLDGIPGSPIFYANRVDADWHVFADHVTDVFIADEVFYDFPSDRWILNRAQAGFQYHLSPNARLLVFYTRQSGGLGMPDRLNVLGLSLLLDIR
jgi:Protein of unknown function (DUF2490)